MCSPGLKLRLLTGGLYLEFVHAKFEASAQPDLRLDPGCIAFRSVRSSSHVACCAANGLRTKPSYIHNCEISSELISRGLSRPSKVAGVGSVTILKESVGALSCMETVLGDWLYCPFTVHFTPKFGYIQLKGLKG